MKRIYLALLTALAVGLVSSIAYAVSPPDPQDEGMRKRITGAKQGLVTKVFVLVRNRDNSANGTGLVSGDVVVWDANSADGITVTTTTTSGDNAIAGILVTTLATGDQAGATSADDDHGRKNWGYIQVYGPALASLTASGANSASAGDLFITSTDAAQVTTLEFAVHNSNDSIGDNSLNSLENMVRAAAGSGGYFITAPSARTLSEVFIRLE